VAIGSAALGAATAAVAIVALIGTGGSGGPSSANAAVLAYVARAMSPPANLIVHVKEAGVQPVGTPVSVEWWQETNPPYVIRIIKGTSGQLHEGAREGAINYSYDAGTKTIYQQPSSKAPTLVDPVETVRAELTTGTAKVAGTVTINGPARHTDEGSLLTPGCPRVVRSSAPRLRGSFLNAGPGESALSQARPPTP